MATLRKKRLKNMLNRRWQDLPRGYCPWVDLAQRNTFNKKNFIFRELVKIKKRFNVH
jgi:hypothetical protein